MAQKADAENRMARRYRSRWKKCISWFDGEWSDESKGIPWRDEDLLEDASGRFILATSESTARDGNGFRTPSIVLASMRAGQNAAQSHVALADLGFDPQQQMGLVVHEPETVIETPKIECRSRERDPNCLGVPDLLAPRRRGTQRSDALWLLISACPRP